MAKTRCDMTRKAKNSWRPILRPLQPVEPSIRAGYAVLDDKPSSIEDRGMQAEPPFEELMGCLRQGDADAGREVFERYARRLVGLAASRLPGALRGKLDPEDIVQSVFR